MGAAGRGVRVAGGSHVVAAAGAALCVVGDVTTPAYQAARRLADALAERRLVGAATGRGLLPQDYDEFAAAKRRELWAASDGEDAAPLLHKGRVLCWEGRHRKGVAGGRERLIGNGGALAAWARDEFGVEDRTHRSAYRYLAAKALRTHINATAGKLSYFFMDLLSSEPDGGRTFLGRVVLELNEGACPRTCANFAALCAGVAAASAGESKTRGYVGCPVHRVKRGGFVQLGDVIDGSGAHSLCASELAGGNEPLGDECYAVPHDRAGVLGMCTASGGRHTGGSQVYITLQPTPWLDCRSVAFGRVVGGMRALRLLEKMDLNEAERPKHEVVVAACGRWEPGELPPLPESLRVAPPAAEPALAPPTMKAPTPRPVTPGLSSGTKKAPSPAKRKPAAAKKAQSPAKRKPAAAKKAAPVPEPPSEQEEAAPEPPKEPREYEQADAIAAPVPEPPLEQEEAAPEPPKEPREYEQADAIALALTDDPWDEAALRGNVAAAIKARSTLLRKLFDATRTMKTGRIQGYQEAYTRRIDRMCLDEVMLLMRACYALEDDGDGGATAENIAKTFGMSNAKEDGAELKAWREKLGKAQSKHDAREMLNNEAELTYREFAEWCARMASFCVAGRLTIGRRLVRFVDDVLKEAVIGGDGKLVTRTERQALQI